MERLIVLDYIKAWRYWQIWPLSKPKSEIASELSLYGLRSAAMTLLWFPGKAMRAVCSEDGSCKMISKDHKNFGVPTRYGACGIYGYKNKEIAVKEIQRYLDYLRGTVLGRVALWGKIYEDGKGIYRAKWAYPLSLELGICMECQNLVSLNKTYLGKLPIFIGVICETCSLKKEIGDYFTILYPPGWHRLIAQKYGISGDT